MNETSLTLYDILVEPMRLMEALEDLRDRDEDDFDEETKSECIAKVEQALDKFMELQPAKIDNFAGFHKECEKRAEINKEEGERLIARSKRWESRKKYLEGRAIQAMQVAGKERIDGKFNTLALRKNPPSVEIAQEALVPAEFRRTTLTLDQRTWDLMIEALNVSHAKSGLAQVLAMALISSGCKTEPEKSEILKQLKASDPCPKCGGSGRITKYDAIGRQVHSQEMECEQCGGSGSIPRGVPGCVLKTGYRLEVC